VSELTVEIDETRAMVRLGGMPGKLKAVLARKTTELRLLLEGLVKTKLSGEVLNVRTGDLRRSIFSDQTETATSVEGRVASSGDVKYARIQEYGGTTSPHDIFPTKGKALAFVMDGKQIFAKVVHHPGSVIPARSYMRSSLAEVSPEIVEGYKSAALKDAGL
jgi:phage gpG-like protein